MSHTVWKETAAKFSIETYNKPASSLEEKIKSLALELIMILFDLFCSLISKIHLLSSNICIWGLYYRNMTFFDGSPTFGYSHAVHITYFTNRKYFDHMHTTKLSNYKADYLS